MRPADTSVSGARPAGIGFTWCLHWPDIFSSTGAKCPLIIEWPQEKPFLFLIAAVYITFLCSLHSGLLCFPCESGLCQWDWSGRNSNWCWSVYPEVFGHCKTDRMFFPTKKVAVICPETRSSYQRGCLGTKEWTAAEGCAGPEALDKAEALAAGAGGHQCAAQEAGWHASGILGLPRAGVCQHSCTSEADLSTPACLAALQSCQTRFLTDLVCWKDSVG